MNLQIFFILLFIQGLYCLHLYGTETSLSKNPIIGPGSRTVYIEFRTEFSKKVTPHVLIAFTKFHFSMAPINHYKASVINANSKGFSIVYETETKNMEFGADMEWIAFDNTSNLFGEVQFIEEFDTQDLKTFHSTGDEHRLQLKTINFKRTYQQPPVMLNTYISFQTVYKLFFDIEYQLVFQNNLKGVAIYVLGASNDGIERLISANYTDTTPFSFTFQALAWHHTELTYYKFAILTYYKDECLSKTGRQYVWDEENHTFKVHPWNQIDEADDKEFRHMHYQIPLQHDTIKSFRPDFIFSGFVGYDIKNYKANSAEFNLQQRNLKIKRNKKFVEMDVGTWNKTQVAGAQWNYLVCETDGDFLGENEYTTQQKFLFTFGSFFATLLIAFLIYQIPKQLNKKKVKEL